MKIEFTEKEAEALVNFIHIAVQAKGLPVAADGVFLAQKIQVAVNAEKSAPPPVEIKDNMENIVELPKREEA